MLLVFELENIDDKMDAKDNKCGIVDKFEEGIKLVGDRAEVTSLRLGTILGTSAKVDVTPDKSGIVEVIPRKLGVTLDRTEMGSVNPDVKPDILGVRLETEFVKLDREGVKFDGFAKLGIILVPAFIRSGKRVKLRALGVVSDSYDMSEDESGWY